MGKGIENVGRVKELMQSWYGSLDALVRDMKDIGLSPEDVTGEYVTAWDEKTEDDVFYTIKVQVVNGTVIIREISGEVF